jgi:hypothetical protein
VLSFTYGHDIKSQDHPLVKLVQRLTDIIVKEITPERAALLQTFPFSKLHLPFKFVPSTECSQNTLNITTVQYLPSLFPGLGFMERAATGKQLAKEVWEQPFECTKREVVRGSLDIFTTSNVLHFTFQGCWHRATIKCG